MKLNRIYYVLLILVPGHPITLRFGSNGVDTIHQTKEVDELHDLQQLREYIAKLTEKDNLSPNWDVKPSLSDALEAYLNQNDSEVTPSPVLQVGDVTCHMKLLIDNKMLELWHGSIENVTKKAIEVVDGANEIFKENGPLVINDTSGTSWLIQFAVQDIFVATDEYCESVGWEGVICAKSNTTYDKKNLISHLEQLEDVSEYCLSLLFTGHYYGNWVGHAFYGGVCCSKARRATHGPLESISVNVGMVMLSGDFPNYEVPILAHELAHLLGARHVAKEGQLMSKLLDDDTSHTFSNETIAAIQAQLTMNMQEKLEPDELCLKRSWCFIDSSSVGPPRVLTGSKITTPLASATTPVTLTTPPITTTTQARTTTTVNPTTTNSNHMTVTNTPTTNAKNTTSSSTTTTATKITAISTTDTTTTGTSKTTTTTTLTIAEAATTTTTTNTITTTTTTTITTTTTTTTTTTETTTTTILTRAEAATTTTTRTPTTSTTTTTTTTTATTTTTTTTIIATKDKITYTIYGVSLSVLTLDMMLVVMLL